MKIIENTTEFNIDGSSSVAIGKFDGIHRGHQLLINKILEAKADGFLAVVFTFDPSPAAFFGDGSYKGLTTRSEKRRIFEKLGVDVLIEYPLTRESASQSPEDFIEEVLIKRIHARQIVCGTDFTFGDRGRGNVNMLRQYGRNKGFEVIVCEKVKSMGEEIGSSLIRNEVEQGHMEMVCEYIGAPYCVSGVVCQGRKLGRTLGVPTVNQVPEDDKLLPPYGVYRSVVSIDGEHYHGITNVGVKPTVTDENRPVVETYIRDFDKDIYGKYISVSLLHFTRPEKKFSSVEELKEQLKKDLEG